MFDLINRGNLPQDVVDEFEHLISQIRGVFLKEHNEDGTHFVRPSGFDFVPIGAMTPWPTDTPPTGWLLCNGQSISRATYAALFAVISTSYGIGDGLTTFNVPDLRGRFPIGKTLSGTASTLAGTGGALDHTHGFSGTTTGASGAHDHGGSTAAVIDHTHPFSGTTDGAASGTTTVAVGAVSSVTDAHEHTFSGTTDPAGAHSHGITAVGTHTHTLGSGTTDANNPPYLVVNYIMLASSS